MQGLGPFYSAASQWRVSLLVSGVLVSGWMAFLGEAAGEIGAVKLLRNMTTASGVWMPVVRGS